MVHIAVIGAGMAGLTAARELKQVADVTVFEKSRGWGGRMATRRATPYAFDHGAQFFTVKTAAFQRLVDALLSDGIIDRWDALFHEIHDGRLNRVCRWDASHPHYVGVPGMSAIGRWLAQDLDVVLQTRVARLVSARQHTLFDDQGRELGEFDAVVVAIPPMQAEALLASDEGFGEPLATRMLGCCALMLGFQEPLSLPFDAALVKGADISWIAANHQKPGRSEACSILIHGTNRWSDEHLDDDRDWVIEHLMAQAASVLGFDVDHADHQALHVWRYANIAKQHRSKAYGHASRKIVLCGDWCVQGRMEAAYHSGLAAAEHIKAMLARD